MKNTNQRIGCCGPDCEQTDECPTLGCIAANSPFALENLKRLRDKNSPESDEG